MNQNFTIETVGSKKGTTQNFTRKLFSLLSLFLLICSVSNANNFLDVSVTSTSVTCPGANDGTATAFPTNGWAPFTYTWSTGATTQSISGLSPGNYSVTVVDVDGAIANGSVFVGAGSGLDLFMSASYETCVGSLDGTAAVNVSGGQAPYSFLWSTGETFVVASDLAAGTYTVTVTDINSCSAVGSVEVELSPEGIWLMTSSTPSDCGLNNGTAHVSVMTGTAPYTIIWSDGQTGEDVTGLAPGTYTVTVTDSNGCSNTESVDIGSNSDLNLSISATNTDCGANNGTATVSVNGGTAPFTYTWSNGGNTATITGLAPGTYSVSVSDVDGCFNTASVTVIGSNSTVILTTTSSNADCGLNNGTATVTASGGTAPYVYAWSNGGNTATISGLAPGTYSVTVSDANTCGSVTSVVVGSNSSAVILNTSSTNADCGLANGSASVSASGGTAPYSYSWSNGGNTATISGLTPGSYTVTVTDANGCSNTATVQVNGTSGVSVSVSGTNADCNTDNGTATAIASGGSGAISYVWNTGSNSSSISNLAPGVYTVTVTDANGCTDSGSVNINGADANGGIITTTDNLEVCAGDGIDDIINVNLTGNVGPNSKWVFTNLSGDIIGLFDNPPFNFEGAGAGVCVIWHLSYQDGLTGLDVGQNVANLNGCFSFSNSLAVVRSDPEGGMVSTNDNTNICVGDGQDDFVDVTLTGQSGTNQRWVITDQAGNILGLPAAPPFNFEGAGTGTCLIWSISYEPGLSGLVEGANVSGLDGCYELSSNYISVERSETPTVALTPSNVSCNGGNDGSISSSVFGGDGNYSYDWSNGSSSANLTNVGPGTYSVTVTDGNGCSSSAEATITEPSQIAVSVSGTDETCPGANDGTASANAVGGTPSYTYLWSNGDVTATINGLTAGSYTVTVTDANGCTVVSTPVTIVTNGITSCSAMVTSSYNEGVDISTFGGSDGTASASANGGSLPYSYLWSNGQSGANANNLSAGTYSVTVTDDGGCTCTSEVTLVDPSKVGNFVWEDENKDGIQDAGETGLGGITIYLTGTSVDGVPVNRTTATAGDGSYNFDGLPTGNYKVTFEEPTGYAVSPLNAGGDPTLDSDMNPATGMTEYFDLGPSECNNDIDAGLYECVNIGDFVFYDGNHDGIQQPWEAGFADALVNLKAAGPDGILCTDDDIFVDGQTTGNDGKYLFECVEPGTYYIEFQVNSSEYMFTDQNIGDDNLDSDANTSTGKTDPFTVTQGMPDDLSFDAGVYLICDDFTSGGQIGYDQEICPGDFPDPLVSITLPSGGYGASEYLWLKSTTGGPINTWMEIPNSDSPTYAPPQLYQTTYFIRCARRENCDNFVAESNSIVIVVNSCVGGLVQNLTATVQENQSRISLDWTTNPEDGLFRYHVEKSIDGIDFDPIGMVNGLGDLQTTNFYNFMDDNPRMGRNIYRVVREDLSIGQMIISNEVEVMFNNTESKFFVFPNPTSGMLSIESLQNMNGNAMLELYNATGQLLDVIEVDYTIGKAEINLDRYTSGAYFIKVSYADKDKTDIIPIIKE